MQEHEIYIVVPLGPEYVAPGKPLGTQWVWRTERYVFHVSWIVIFGIPIGMVSHTP